jgi:subtilisin family serine protease
MLLKLGRAIALTVAAAALTAGDAAAARQPALCVAVDPVIDLGCREQTEPTAAGNAQQQQASPSPQADSDSVAASWTSPHVDTHHVAVTVLPSVSRREVRDLFAQAGVALERAVPQIRAYLGRVAPEHQTAAVAELDRSPLVLEAEREVFMQAYATHPDDVDWNQQWGLRLIGLPQAWDVTRGADGLVVAVVDTGVDPEQADLRGALVPGYDFVNRDADPRDDEGHGTSVAGIIAARGDNHTGTAGVCWRCKIMPVKVLGTDGVGDDSVIAAGVVWAADHGARVINLSLGGPVTTQDLSNAVAYAVGHGAVVVAAAGNSASTTPFYPAAEPAALSVAATTSSDRAYSWSNYGPWVDVAAPGCNAAPSVSGHSVIFCGTSSATPVVSGVAALALAAQPSADPARVVEALEAGSVPLAGVVKYGRIRAPETLDSVRPATPAASGQVFRDSVGGDVRSRTYTLTVGRGRLAGELVFGRRETLSLRLSRGGRTVATKRGRSPLRVGRNGPGGTFAFTVSGARTTTPYVLTITSPGAG